MQNAVNHLIKSFIHLRNGIQTLAFVKHVSLLHEDEVDFLFLVRQKL